MPQKYSSLRGELHCFACSRYLGDFESHPEQHGYGDIHLIQPEGGSLPQHAVETAIGLRCSRCGGRAILDYVDGVRAAAA